MVFFHISLGNEKKAISGSCGKKANGGKRVFGVERYHLRGYTILHNECEQYIYRWTYG